jgi:hypothetical protein
VDDLQLPSHRFWDHRATEEQARAWIHQAAAGSSSALWCVKALGDPRAAPAIRDHLVSPELAERPTLLAALANSLGWSGDLSDGDRLVPLLTHTDAAVRKEARWSLLELKVPTAADRLHALLGNDLAQDERNDIVECLVHLHDARTRDPLRAMWDAPGDTRIPRTRLMAFLAAVGTVQDRADLADEVVRLAEQAAALHPGDVDWNTDLEAWRPYWEALQHYRAMSGVLMATLDEVAPVECRAMQKRILALDGLPEEMSSPLREALGVLEPDPTRQPRTVPTLAWRTTSDTPVPERPWPPAKFGGQPDWRQKPEWPVLADGTPLEFYGQLPLPGLVDRTVYLFFARDRLDLDEFTPLGPGNAAIVQPGQGCQLPTTPTATGPQVMADVLDQPVGARRRSRWLPMLERFVVVEDFHDPVSWAQEEEEVNPFGADDDRHWNKLGGTPRWLQGEESPPGEGWSFAFQFSADSAGGERGDGAECYGWTHSDGRAAFGWQCH